MFSILESKKVMGKMTYKFVDTLTSKPILPKFLGYTRPDYLRDKIYPIEPMTAKEEDNQDKLNSYLKSNSGYYAEEKLDGVRATIHFTSKGIRVFSRNIAKESDWYNEYTDLVPHIRDLKFPRELEGTILDGELTLVGKTFKDISSTLNCTWEESLARQINLGVYVSSNLFDIIRYKGIYVARLSYLKRKKLLEEITDIISQLKLYPADNIQRFRSIKYFDDYIVIPSQPLMDCLEYKGMPDSESYPNLVSYINDVKSQGLTHIRLTKIAYYEYVVFTGGEGIILKNKDGKYYHKRGKEYIKVKKELTRDLILLNFNPPTKEYTGKLPNDWEYFEDGVPVTKHYYNNWVGNMVLGVVITKEELSKLPKKKDRVTRIYGDKVIIEVCECSGFTEELREYFTTNRESLEMNLVIEVLCNEIFSDTGKMRHPRFNRIRRDKDIDSCTWSAHINE